MMGTTMNFGAYKRLVEEDLTWLLAQPRSLERDHIEAILMRNIRDRAHYELVTARPRVRPLVDTGEGHIPRLRRDDERE